MERQANRAVGNEARLVRAARSLDRSRRLIASAQAREEKALSTLLCHLAQTGQTHAVFGLFELTLADEGLNVRRLAGAPAAQLSLPHLALEERSAAALQVADPSTSYTPALYEAPACYRASSPARDIPRQVHFLAPEDAQLLHVLEDLADRARDLTPQHYRAPEGGALRITSPADVAALLSCRMVDLPQEQLRLLTLSVKNDLLGEHLVYQGTLNSAPVRPAEVFRRGFADNAAAMIAVHNHPSGDPAPSSADMQRERTSHGDAHPRSCHPSPAGLGFSARSGSHVIEATEADIDAMTLEPSKKVGADAVSGYPTSHPTSPPFLGTTGAGKGILDGEMHIKCH